MTGFVDLAGKRGLAIGIASATSIPAGRHLKA